MGRSLEPRENEWIENSLKYLNYTMEGGYRKHELLATWTLFAIQYNFKDEKKTEIIPLSEYLPILTTERLNAAIDHYQIAAQHSSLFGLLRISESYFYGIGREQDLIKAYAWSQLVDYAYQELIRRKQPLNWNIHEGKIIIQYNQKIAQQLIKSLNPEQQKEGQQLFEQLKSTIIAWDHDIWVNGIDDFNPKP